MVSREQGLVRQARRLSGLLECYPLAFIFDHDAGASVVVLLRAGGPSTVFRAVVSVVVYAIYGQALDVAAAGGPFCEGVEAAPLRADADPAPTVSVKVFVVGVGASVVHISEYFEEFVGGRLWLPIGTVRPAVLRSSADNIELKGEEAAPARASAKNDGLAADGSDPAEDCPAAVSLADGMAVDYGERDPAPTWPSEL